MRIRSMLLIALASASLAACGGKKSGGTTTTTPPASGDKTLYDRLGGQDAIKAVVKDFVEERVAKDARINAFFANADIPGLEGKLVDQICMATGGPCKYTGKDMKTAHAGLGIADKDFTALVEDLTASLKKFNVGDKEQGELLNALGGMKPEIVTK
jgi:hemoglobin